MQLATFHPVIDKPCTDRLRENRSRRRRISHAIAGRVARLLEQYENGEQMGPWGAESAAFEIECLFGIDRRQTLRYFIAVEAEAQTLSLYNGELSRCQRVFHGNCMVTPRLP
jgi:hypothetical protein